MQNYFQVLSLPEGFPIDAAVLQQAYFAAQRRFHPDRLVGKTPPEREQAIRQSMLINEAYETLKSPLKRARHLLALAGIDSDSAKASPKLLMEAMESREALAEANDKPVLEKLAEENATAREETLADLQKAFAGRESLHAAELCMRLSYLVKIEEEICLAGKRLQSEIRNAEI